ncbi:MAG: PEP-CTERM sorting domain-containing protein [Steroidobacteraceae bacterium]
MDGTVNKFTRATLVLCSLIGSHAQASPIIQNYAFDLTFTHVTFNPCSAAFPGCTHGDPVLPGVRYTGYFGVDAANLLNDGYVNAPFAYFNFTLGSFTWDVNLPNPLSDFRGTDFYNPDTGIGGRDPNRETFLVADGNVQAICCGVYGSGDVPFVDLVGFDRTGNTGASYADAVSSGGSRDWFAGTGTFAVYRVPEPGTLALMLIGLPGIGAVLYRRRARNRRA